MTLQEKIESKIERRGGKWIWTGGIHCKNKVPVYRAPDGRSIQIIRWIYCTHVDTSTPYEQLGRDVLIRSSSADLREVTPGCLYKESQSSAVNRRHAEKTKPGWRHAAYMRGEVEQCSI